MFSIIVNAAKYVLGSQISEEPSIDELIARLEDAQDNTHNALEIANARADNDPQGCFYKTGIATNITEDHVLVDRTYMCDIANVYVNDLKTGDKVHYMAYRRNQNEVPIIRKIISRVDDNWDCDEFETSNLRDVEECEKSDICEVAQTIKKNIVAKVMRREGRLVFLEPVSVSLNLDKVNSTFIPCVGDWVQLESLVEVDENSGDLGGEVLQVNNLQPLRSSLKVGTVTQWDQQIGVGAVDKNVVFNKASCEPGYVPYVGDKVVADCIESDQGIYTWRSLSVVPLVQISHREALPMINNGSQLSNDRNNFDVLLRDKHGIVITNDLTATLNIHGETQLFVTIENTGKFEQTLIRGVFMSKKAQSQLSLISPRVDTSTRICSGKSCSYVFGCNAKFVGTTEELFIFVFKGFKIGRMFRITVNPKNFTRYSEPITNGRTEINIATQGDYDQGNYVQGVRPCKPPSFIAVRNGVFRIPQRFWDAVLPGHNEKRTAVECEIAASDAIPCLTEGLSRENYATRFHALLYLEEISLTIELQRYDMESAILLPRGEYLGLTVPGLAEKRPSLIVGDRAIVSFDWDYSGGKVKYEGYVHKVQSSEVLLKFNQTFHEKYNTEECRVTFKSSYSSIARCHSAINLAMINLGSEILFPTRISEKDPQINLNELDPEEKPKLRTLSHNRSESLSSVCSNTSVTSTSDTSSDSVTRNPRLTVAERLFQAKPKNDNPPKTEKPSTKSEILSKPTKNSSSLDPKKHDETSTKFPKKSTQSSSQQDPNVAQLKKRNLIWYNKKLNYYQKEAVRNILKGVARPLPYVIFGPPGTGKTITLCETALQLLSTLTESRLLIATPSNSSANLIAERLLDSGALKPGDLVRLVAHHCLEDDSIPERLLPYCATGNLAAEWSQTEKQNHDNDKPRLNCTMSCLGRHRITVGTCIALGLLYNMGFPRGHFTHILIDEAGQATEPEIMVPLTFVHSSCGQIILAGDPMQLGPVVNSKLAGNFGLAESFLSRLLQQFPYQRDNVGFEMGYDPRLVTKLVMNYRSLPEILQLPNSLFYDSELRPQVSATKSPEAEILRSMMEHLPRRSSGQCPAIVFHGVNGENVQDADSPSWYNPAEATQAYLYLLKLYESNISGEDVGIITPYQKQVRQIRDLLMELDVTLPKVGSVEEFQGQERKVIILSAVRSASNFVTEDIRHALGFVASPRRLNVAITRARALLIILGNPELLSQDPYWRSVIIYCIERGCYTGCNFLSSYLEDCIDDDDEDGVI